MHDSLEDPGPEQADHIDKLGAVASSICVVHCAIAALLPAAFAALGLGFLVTEETEWVLVALAIVFAAGALVLGWRKHRSVPVAVILGVGIVGLLASRGLEMGSGHGHHEEHTHAHHEAEVHADAEEHAGGWHGVGTAVGVAGGLLLLVGHALNHRELRRCREGCQSAQAAQQPS